MRLTASRIRAHRWGGDRLDFVAQVGRSRRIWDDASPHSGYLTKLCPSTMLEDLSSPGHKTLPIDDGIHSLKDRPFRIRQGTLRLKRSRRPAFFKV